MVTRSHAKTCIPSLLAITLTLTGCSGGGAPGAAKPSVAASTPSTSTVSTGNATIDSALNGLGDVRTALDGIRTLGSSSSSSLSSQGFRVAGFMVQQETGTAGSPPPEFRDPFAGGSGSRTEERQEPRFDGRVFQKVAIKIKIVDTQVGSKHTHQEFDISNGEPGTLLREGTNEAVGDGTIRDSFTNLFRDPQGVLHKIVNVSVHPPFDPNRFQFDPNQPPPPPADGSIQEFISTDDGKTFTQVGSGEIKDGIATQTREFDDPQRKVHVKELNSNDQRNGKNSNQHFENGELVFSHTSERTIEVGKVLIREIQDGTFTDPAGNKHRHKSNILRLGDFFGGFVGPPPGGCPGTATGGTLTTQQATAPAAPAPTCPVPAPAPLTTKQTTAPAPGASPGNTGGASALPGSGIALPPAPNQLPLPPGTIDALIEDFLNGKLVHRLKFHTDSPGDPTKVIIQETNIDPATGQELQPDNVTVNADGTRTVVKHLPNGHTITVTIDPNLPGPPTSEEKDKDGQLVQKVERTATSITITFFAPPGTPRHIVRWTITSTLGGGQATFEEFDVRDGKEVKVAIGKLNNGKISRTTPDGSALNDDFGAATTETKPIDADTDEQSTTQDVGGRKVKLVKRVKKIKRQTGGDFTSSGEFKQGQTVETDQVTGVQQVIGDGDVTIDFDDDITSVDQTNLKIKFRSGGQGNGQFNGKISKGSSQATVDGDFTTPDGHKFKCIVTQTIGSLGLSGTIDLTSDDGAFNINIDLTSDGTGVGTVKDLKLNRRIFTISIGTSGKAIIRDANDQVVQREIPVFNKT